MKGNLLSRWVHQVFFYSNAKFLSNTGDAVHSFCLHCLPNKWHLMSVMLSASNCLDWIPNKITNTSIDEALKNIENYFSESNLKVQLHASYLIYRVKEHLIMIHILEVLFTH